MFTFSDTDFQDIVTFPLSYIFPEDVILQIKSFTQLKAKEMCQSAGAYLRSQRLQCALFECADWIDEFTPMPEKWQKVRDWLLSKVSDRGQEIVIHYDEDTAILTRWGVFCDYLADFCYAGDLRITPPAITWFLQCQHGDIFTYSEIAEVGMV
jgi:hypothetical protein